MSWRETIISLLDGTAPGISRERLDWTGYVSVYKLWTQAPPHERDNIIDAMAQIIDEASDSPSDEEKCRLAADTIHLGYSLHIKALKFVDAVHKLDPGKTPSQVRDTVSYALDTYLKTYKNFPE